MRSLGTRAAALLAGTATVAVVTLSGCSAGQVAETSLKKPSVYGLNAASSDGSVLVRDLAVVYNGTSGYPAGGDAPLEVNLFNQTSEAITVLVSSRPPQDKAAGVSVVSGQSVGLTGSLPDSVASAAPAPSGSRPPAIPDTDSGPSDSVIQPSVEPSTDQSSAAGGESASASSGMQPARIEIGPHNTVSFLPGDDEMLVVSGLSGKLTPGAEVNLVFEFSNGAEPLSVRAPMAIPSSPASRAPAVPDETHAE
ncbi:hypothetical protein [Mangrovihabitans endophyticus]|uniref:Copper(I)-binding protein n=1 Tax=Mangrovihabitans endophyticus TaxID=1751298 RepID=A0A8J3C385_9ACTN|nr:hypothetical protein [Mangrovihabitans endophyticus]GGL03019.1 hypothetical protein GCM10012284_42070 [Mangrovihabitans endophyticus]